MTPTRRLHFLVAILVVGNAAHAGIDFKKEILPLLENHCLKCHRAAHEENGRLLKPKGDVRLDAAWALLAGNKDITPVKPKNCAHSDIIRVVTLPRDDDKAMPPDGKGDPLTPAEVVKLRTWITEGADFGGWEGNVEGKPAAPLAVARMPVRVREHELLYKKLAEGLAPIATDVLKRIQATSGAQVTPLSPGNSLLRVDFLTGVTQCNDNAVAALAPIRENIAHLDLARTSITDEALKSVARMSRLTRLDLRKTKITDAGIVQLGALKNLVYLNLFGTEVTDEALATLASIKSLKSVYLFETRSTDAGVDKLRLIILLSLVATPLLSAAPTATIDPPAAAREMDALLAKDWAKHNLKPNPPATDEVFVRRVYLDIVGRIPTVRETEEFLAATDPDKRSHLIDALLASDGYALHVFNYWADVLRLQQFGRIGQTAGAAYVQYLKDSLRTNKPYDQLVRELITAKGKPWENGAIGYYMRDNKMPLDNFANTARVFLGTRIECAQCHNHPFDKWKQVQFYQMSAFTYGNDVKAYENPAIMQSRELLKAERKDLAARMKEDEKAAGEGTGRIG